MLLPLPSAAQAAVDPGDILVADPDALGGQGTIFDVDPLSGTRVALSTNTAPLPDPTFDGPLGVALEPDGDILVADPDAFGGQGALIRVDATTGRRTLLSSNTAPAGGPDLDEPRAIAFEADGDILVVNGDSVSSSGDGSVIRVDPVSGERELVSANGFPTGGPDFVNPYGIAVQPDGNILIANEDGFGDGSGGVIRVDPETGARSTVSSNSTPVGGPSFSNPIGIALEHDGDILITDSNAFGGGGGVIRVDPVSGVRTTVSDDTDSGPQFATPAGIAVELDGDILVADEDTLVDSLPQGAVLRIDPATGTRTVISANGAPAGGPDFVEPSGLALDGAGNILIADEQAFLNARGGVIRVHPLTGARTVVSSNEAPAGSPQFDGPLGIAVVWAPLDVDPPETTIDSGPSGLTNATTASFTFSADEEATFECKLDSGTFVACASGDSFGPLANGVHTFSVRATDTAGNVDETPAQLTLEVRACTISGTSANETLKGTKGDDVLCGFGGDDVFKPSAGADIVFGGTGNDKISASPGADRLLGQDGDDSVDGGPSDDELDGGTGTDACAGGPGTDTAVGCESVTGVP